MRYRLLLVAVLALTMTATAQKKDSADVMLGAALHQEEVEGNCKEAIRVYEKLVKQKDVARNIAARAQLHVGFCREKLGLNDARAAYEAVLSRYQDQTELAALARKRLSALGANVESQPALRVERIWEGPSIDVQGRPFSDGSRFAFADWSAGPGVLAIRDLRTGEKRVLTTDSMDADFVSNPLPSPDGKRIAYRFGERDPGIRLIDADGSNMRVLLRDNHRHEVTGWSPDGRSLAARDDGINGTVAIVVISTSDGSVRQLKSMASPGVSVGGFSPDGRYIVYAKNNDPRDRDGGVFALAADGSQEHRLVESSRQGVTGFSAPLWSPDGRRVFFLSDRSGSQALWSIEVANGKAQGSPQRFNLSTENMFPRGIGKDGSLYYLTQEISVESYIGELDPRTQKVVNWTTITDRAVGNNRGPEISPDGASVAFIRRRVGTPWAVMVKPLAGGEELEVGTINGSGAYGARTLQWFPNGLSLLVIDGVDNNQRKRFRQIDVKTGEVKLLFEGPWAIWTAALAADGKSVFYSLRGDGDHRLIRRHLNTGEETELFSVKSPGAGLFGLIASPDGTSLAFTRNLELAKRALFVLPIEGGVPRELHRSEWLDGKWIAEIGWTPDSRKLIVTADAKSLFVIPAGGGSLEPLGVTMQEVTNPGISPDGQRIVFGGRTRTEQLWVVRNLFHDQAKSR